MSDELQTEILLAIQSSGPRKEGPAESGKSPASWGLDGNSGVWVSLFESFPFSIQVALNADGTRGGQARFATLTSTVRLDTG